MSEWPYEFICPYCGEKMSATKNRWRGDVIMCDNDGMLEGCDFKITAPNLGDKEKTCDEAVRIFQLIEKSVKERK